MLDGLVSNLSGAEFKIDEDLINFGEKLERADKNAPGKIYDGLNKMGNDLKKELKANTPIGPPKKREPSKKKMVNRWRKSQASREFGNYTVKIRSTAPHFHLVERGHKIIPRGGKKSKKPSYKRKAKGYVKGQHFAKKILDKRELDIYQEFDDLLDEILEDIE